MNTFYVYVHRRADNGEIFYVGKGSRNRFRTPRGRSPTWHEAVARHGFTAHVVEDGLTEAEAYEVERSFITTLRNLGHDLVNLSAGGTGVFQPKASTRARMSVRSKAKWADPIWRTKMEAALKASKADPSVRSRMAAGVAAAWANPETRTRQVAAIRKAHEDRDMIARRTETLILTLAKPEARQRKSEITTALYAKRDNRRLLAKATRVSNTDAAPLIGIDTREGPKGVRYIARIRVWPRGEKYLGSFRTLGEAQRARRSAEVKYWRNGNSQARQNLNRALWMLTERMAELKAAA